MGNLSSRYFYNSSFLNKEDESRRLKSTKMATMTSRCRQKSLAMWKLSSKQ
ncbi:hypothetical protein Gotur_032758 [Gossypium turneri]